MHIPTEEQLVTAAIVIAHEVQFHTDDADRAAASDIFFNSTIVNTAVGSAIRQVVEGTNLEAALIALVMFGFQLGAEVGPGQTQTQSNYQELPREVQFD